MTRPPIALLRASERVSGLSRGLAADMMVGPWAAGRCWRRLRRAVVAPADEASEALLAVAIRCLCCGAAPSPGGVRSGETKEAVARREGTVR